MSFLFQKNISKHSPSESIFTKPLIQNHSSYNDDNQTDEKIQNKSIENNSGFEFENLPIQPKLKISKPNDPYEREADRIAEKIVNMPLSDSKDISSQKDQDTLNRKCTKCEMEEEELSIHRKIQSSSSVYLEPPNEIVQKIDPIKMSQGSSLDSSTRGFMEPRFGFDFGRVRIHTDSNAVKANASIHARAFTMGNDIYFNDGGYDPKTTQGRKLLAHELTHVVQQTGEQNQLGFETNHLKTSPLGNSLSGSLLENNMMYLETGVHSGEHISVMNFTHGPIVLSPSWSCGWEEADYWASIVGLAAAVVAAIIAVAGALAPDPTVTKVAAILAVVAALGLLYNAIRAARNLKHCYETDPDADRREIERLNQEMEENRRRVRELEEGLERLRELAD
ncbi:MAG: DUF4157 domain-containing protein [Nitrosopumilus sp.]|nr:DUF4157 domain-containing protein [Nitrosopumilus sp.]MDH3735396.1 DUF4157 domain-containing protein [Nitrosopumilus sp.]MDH3822242.1 DUF4157 domain-containing protein [Nitrosopumilus sp.]MDH3832570.1 DUF4157 domain-containing protein [Nitrosopumilus sp.]